MSDAHYHRLNLNNLLINEVVYSVSENFNNGIGKVICSSGNYYFFENSYVHNYLNGIVDFPSRHYFFKFQLFIPHTYYETDNNWDNYFIELMPKEGTTIKLPVNPTPMTAEAEILTGGKVGEWCKKSFMWNHMSNYIYENDTVSFNFISIPLTDRDSNDFLYIPFLTFGDLGGIKNSIISIYLKMEANRFDLLNQAVTDLLNSMPNDKKEAIRDFGLETAKLGGFFDGDILFDPKNHIMYVEQIHIQQLKDDFTIDTSVGLIDTDKL